MTFSLRMAAGMLSAVLLAIDGGASVPAQRPADDDNIDVSHRSSMTVQASGTFEVKLTPQPADEHADGTALGRMTIDKQFRGDLEATGTGQMLTAMSSVKGSAGYVAIERVSGALAGRRGTFVLQHTGTMTRGTPSLTVTVVPDSGTEQLTGLSGRMVINVADGQHSYEFDYTLPAR